MLSTNTLRFFLFFIAILVAHTTIAEESIKQITVNDYLQQAKEKAKKQGRKANRLINESSPYLLQHAYNPVQWYAWGDAAFEKARKENKPIFLSIGYSTCHWCHVMAHESFENKEISDFLNKYFISIKVDREQRPDIDTVYMSATQLINGHGGWPMTVFLDQHLRPFHAATYYPPFTVQIDDEQKRTGLKEVLLRIHDLWENQPGLINEVATSVTARITALADETIENGVLEKNINTLALKQISASFDEDTGGFSAAPKFPRPGIFAFLNKLLLIDLNNTYSEKISQNQVEQVGHINTTGAMMRLTLDEMAAGGIYDQVAGGFHRYSVDADWQVPHFEKMLYSQALMSIAYSDYYRIDPQQKYKQVVLETLAFVTKEMQSPGGGFYSALDADSKRVKQQGEDKAGELAEGAYYLWHVTELKKILSPIEFEFVKKYFHVRENGNIDSDPQGEFSGLNIFYIDDEFKNRNLTASQTILLVSVKKKLNKIRLQRPRPHLDDKIITAWNGMMLTAFSRASVAFNEPLLLDTAIQALTFIKNNLYVKKDKTLYRQFWVDRASSGATLSDYVWLIYGLLDVYEASNDRRWFNWAFDLHESQNRLFLDKKSGAYFESVANDASLLFRSKSIYDGAMPSANAVALANIRKFSALSSELVQKKRYLSQADKLVSSFATVINHNPASASMLLSIEAK